MVKILAQQLERWLVGDAQDGRQEIGQQVDRIGRGVRGRLRQPTGALRWTAGQDLNGSPAGLHVRWLRRVQSLSESVADFVRSRPIEAILEMQRDSAEVVRLGAQSQGPWSASVCSLFTTSNLR